MLVAKVGPSSSGENESVGKITVVACYLEKKPIDDFSGWAVELQLECSKRNRASILVRKPCSGRHRAQSAF
jgi:hypothetical protein